MNFAHTCPFRSIGCRDDLSSHSFIRCGKAIVVVGNHQSRAYGLLLLNGDYGECIFEEGFFHKGMVSSVGLWLNM